MKVKLALSQEMAHFSHFYSSRGRCDGLVGWNMKADETRGPMNVR